jgi:hypothetical protein
MNLLRLHMMAGVRESTLIIIALAVFVHEIVVLPILSYQILFLLPSISKLKNITFYRNL